MTQEEFKKLCKTYLPNCHFKDGNTCGLLCYDGGNDIFNIIVALLPRGEFAVYDRWREITETYDIDYVKDWLEHCSYRYKKCQIKK